MNRVTSALATVILLVFLNGCAVVETQPDTEKPSWAQEPESRKVHPGFLSAVGQGVAGAPEEALERATLEGRARLSESVSGYVGNSFAAFLEANPEWDPGRELGTRQFADALATEVSSDIMRRTIQKQSWAPEDNGSAYVLLRIPLTTVHNAIKDGFAALNRDYSLFEPDREETVLETFSEHLDSALQKRLSEAAKPEPGKAPEDTRHHPPPEWLATGRSSRYPSDRYLLAIGLGDNLLQAENNARRAALQRVAGLARTVAHAGGEDSDDLSDHHFLRQAADLPAARLHSFPENIIDVRIAKLWYDSAIDVHYAMAVINRASAAGNCSAAAKKQIDEWRQRQSYGLNQEKAGNFKEALEDMLVAAANGEAALHNCLTAYALSPALPEIGGCNEKLEGLSLAGTYSDLNRLLRQFKIIPEKGPGRWTPAERTARRHLSVRIVVGPDEQPVRGMPVKFELVDLGGEFARSGGSSVIVESDRDGAAGTEVRNIRDISRMEGADIRISLAAAEILTDKGIYARLDTPAVDFSYERAHGSTMALAVRIGETGPDGEAPPDRSSGRNALIERLENAGVSLLGEDRLHLSPEDISDAMDGNLDGVVRAVGETIGEEHGADILVFLALGGSQFEITATRSTSLGELIFAVCRTEVHMIKAGETPEVIAVVGAEGMGAAIEQEEEALAEAREEAAAKIAEEILSYLRP